MKVSLKSWNTVFGRTIILAVALSWTLPIVQPLLKGKLATNESQELFDYHGTKGPFSAEIDKDGKLRIGELKSSFRAGDTVAWVTDINVVPGTTVSSEFTMYCNNKIVAAEDRHLLSGQVRPDGPLPYSIKSPSDVPLSDCEIKRVSDFISGDGKRRVKKIFPSIFFRINQKT